MAPSSRRAVRRVWQALAITAVVAVLFIDGAASASTVSGSGRLPKGWSPLTMPDVPTFKGSAAAEKTPAQQLAADDRLRRSAAKKAEALWDRVSASFIPPGLATGIKRTYVEAAVGAAFAEEEWEYSRVDTHQAEGVLEWATNGAKQDLRETMVRQARELVNTAAHNANVAWENLCKAKAVLHGAQADTFDAASDGAYAVADQYAEKIAASKAKSAQAATDLARAVNANEAANGRPPKYPRADARPADSGETGGEAGIPEPEMEEEGAGEQGAGWKTALKKHLAPWKLTPDELRTIRAKASEKQAGRIEHGVAGAAGQEWNELPTWLIETEEEREFLKNDLYAAARAVSWAQERFDENISGRMEADSKLDFLNETANPKKAETVSGKRRAYEIATAETNRLVMWGNWATCSAKLFSAKVLKHRALERFWLAAEVGAKARASVDASPDTPAR